MFLSNKNKAKIYQLYYTNEITGRITKISTKAKVKSEAMKFVSDFKEQLKTNKNTFHSKVVYLSDIKEEIFRYVSDNFTKNTLSIYKNSLRNFEKLFKDKPLKSITVKDIENFKNDRLKAVSKVTINIEIITLRATFNLLIKWGFISENVFSEVNKFKIEEKKRECFTDSEIKLIINNIDDKDFRNLVLVAIYTGCRVSEIINIQYSDVDLSARILTIGNKENFNTKSKRIRNIPISDNLNTVLCEAMGIETNIICLNSPDKYLFSIRGNIKLNRDYITRKFKKYLRKLNIDGCFHSLRHYFITSLIKSGINLNYVKELAGHSEIKTTMNYIHILSNDLREAVNKVNLG